MKFVIGIILVLSGVAIGVGINHYYPTFPIEDKINLVDLTTLLITIFLAIYIPVFFEKHMHNKRYEKDVIIRKIEGLQSTMKDVNKFVTECVQKNAVSAANCHSIINCFTTISNELDTLITLMDHCHKDKFKDEIVRIKSLRHQYKTTVTGGNFQRKNFKYPALTKKEEEVTYHKMDKELCMLIFKVNGI